MFGRVISIRISILCAALAALVLLRPQPAAAAGDIARTLDSLGTKVDIVDRRLAQEQWRSIVLGQSDSLAFFEGLKRSVLTDDRTFSILRGASKGWGDEQEQRLYDLLYGTMLTARLSFGSGLYPLYDSLTAYFSTAWPRLQDQPTLKSNLERTMRTSANGAAREAAYRALTSPDGLAIDQIGRLLRQRNQAAKRMGYNDCFRLLLSARGLRVSDYTDLLDQIDDATAPLYDSLLLDLQTGQTTGGLEIWDWAHHFAGDFAAIDSFFPVDSQVDILKRSMQGIGFDLDALPIYFHTVEDSTQPVARMLVVDVPGDVRIITRLTDGVEGMRKLLGVVGQALYMVYITQETPAFKRMISPEMENGINRYFQNLTLEPRWLETYAGVPQATIQRYIEAQRGVDVLKFRQLLVAAAFEAEAYGNPNQDLNKVYWRLFDKYLSLPRHDDLTPWAGGSLLVTSPLGYRDLLVGAIIARQSAKQLDATYGKPVNNRDVRAFLEQNYFRFGSRYPWQELVERATGNSLAPQALTAVW